VKFIAGDALKELPEETFDVVILSNVLEHLHDRVGFLKRLVQITHPSRLLIRVPLFERDWQVALKKEMGVEWRLDPTHFIEYTLEAFVDEINAANLCVLHKEVRWGEIWSEIIPLQSE
jgi:SAM-dependent methyltransferase